MAADPTQTTDPSTGDDPPNTDQPGAKPDTLGDPGKAALDAERNARKTAEKTLRTMQAELDAIKQQSMSETEKAIATARAEARTEALRESGSRLVDAEVRAAAAGRNIDVKALLDGVDRSRFLDADGEPDTDRIAKWVDRIAPATEQTQPGVPRVPTGPRSPTNPKVDPAQEFASFLTGQLKTLT